LNKPVPLIKAIITLIFLKFQNYYLIWSKHRKTQDFLKENTFVKFGDVLVSYVTLINNTHCLVHSPLSPSPVPVELTFNDQEWTTNGILFYHYFPPYVFQIIPDFGNS